MLNKVLIFGGMALSAILIVENMVVPTQAFVFLSRNSTSWMLSVVSILIWIWIWFGLKWFLSQDSDWYDDNLDF